jgi:hypothetical protein
MVCVHYRGGEADGGVDRGKAVHAGKCPSLLVFNRPGERWCQSRTRVCAGGDGSA